MVDKDRTSTENDRYATNKQHTYQLTIIYICFWSTLKNEIGKLCQ
jgi:hypothetical protein